MPSTVKARPRAFTLVELTVVVLVMGIMASIAAPRYMRALASSRVQSAARRVAADIRLAREYAMKNSIAETVTFTVGTDSYAFGTMPDVNRPELTYSVSLPASPYPADIASANFEGFSQFQFDMYGRASRAGSVVLQASSEQRTVQVDKVGNISILP
jgi:type IV fimbrial biogenesis protein FimT